MSNVRFNTCLQWMIGMLRDKPSAVNDGGIVKPIEDHLNSQNSGTKLSPDVIATLSSPLVYWSVYQSFMDTHKQQQQQQQLVVDDDMTRSFWPLIQSLARQGIYLIKDDDTSINHTLLTSKDPFDRVAHCAVMEGLMKCHASVQTPSNRIVKETRRLFGLSASKELPSSTEEALLLWINKACQATFSRRQRLCQEILQEENPAKKREARLRLARIGGGVVEHCRRASTVDDLSDGQCLAAALMYYRPEIISWKDFHFSRQLLIPENSLSNLRAISHHCDRFLSQPKLHIRPEHWHSYPQELRTNIFSFLSLLFDVLTKMNREGEMRTKGSFVLCLSKERIASGPPRIKSTDNSQNKHFHNSWLSLSNQAPNHSLNNSTMMSSSSASQPGSNSEVPDLFQADTNKQLHSFSMPEMTTGSDKATGSRIIGGPETQQGLLFSAVIRDRNSTSQTNLLSSFHPKPTNRSTEMSSTANAEELISASVERLGIKEEMKKVQIGRAGSHVAKTKSRYSMSGVAKEWNENETDTAIEERDREQFWNGIENQTEKNGNEDGPNNDNRVSSSTVIDNEIRVENETEKDEHETIRNGNVACTEENKEQDAETKTSIVRFDEDGMGTGTRTDNATPTTGRRSSSDSERQQRENTPEPLQDMLVTRSPSRRNLENRRLLLRMFPEEESRQAPPTMFETNEDALLLRAKVRHKMKQIETKRKERRYLREQNMMNLIKQELVQGSAFPSEPLESSHPVPILSVPSSQELDHCPSEDLRHCPSQKLGHRPSQELESRPSQELGYNPKQELPGYYPSQEMVHRPPQANATSVLSHKTFTVPTRPRGNSRPSSANSRPSSSKSRPSSSRSNNSRPTSSMSNNSRPTSSKSRSRTVQQQTRRETDEKQKQRAMEAERKQRRKEEIKMRLEERDRERRRVAKERKIRTLSRVVEEETGPVTQPTGDDYSTDHYHSKPVNRAVNRTVLLADDKVGMKGCSAGQNKSNRKLVRNALCYVCLAGEANITIKQKALTVLEASTHSHFYILFRDTLGLKFKGLYALLTTEELKIVKLFGTGPKTINEVMVKQFFKYNSGTKSFQAVVAYSFSISTDALTILDHHWHATQRNKQTRAVL